MSGSAVGIERVPVDAGAWVADGRTNAYLVGRGDALLIDPGGRTGGLDAAVAARDVGHILVTHTHPDHVGGVVHYADALDATLWGRAGREHRFRQATGLAPDATFREGTTVGPATVIETPGHSSDHVAFAVGAEAVTGDVAFAEGSVGIGPTGDLRAYLTTLRRLLARDFDRLHPGHGSPVVDPAATIRRLIEHRLDREAMVVRAVAGGARTADEIVGAVYDVDLGDAASLAALTVRAHLRKLDVEGTLDWDGDRATPG